MKAIIAALTLLTMGAALAQAAPLGEPETVYSDAQRQKDEQLSRRFVQSLLRPSTSLEGQFAKWKGQVCPHVYGVNPASALVIERRIREIATQVGAPVDRDDPCIANVSIIFTDQPQARLDALAAVRPFLLQGNDQKLTVRYPVQAWYAALREDYAGNKQLDIPWQIAEPWRDCIPEVICDLPQSRSNDSKLHSGQTTEIATATVLVDDAAAAGLTLGKMGDYLALLTLAQTPVTGRCQPAPSISNLFLANCGADFHTTALSEVDLAMLTALYQTPDQPEKLQAMRIVGNMQRNLEGENRK